MSEPFQPNEGDTVEFYNSEAELWEPGTVSSYAADRRLYFVEPDEESQSGWLVNHTNIRPLADATPVEAPSFWEAAKTYARANRSLSAIVDRQEREVNSLKARQNSIADERDNWVRQAIANRERAEKAETEVAKLQAQIDAAPYATGYPVGDRVAARLAEYRERAHSAEARAEKAEAELAKTRNTIVELRAALRTLAES